MHSVTQISLFNLFGLYKREGLQVLTVETSNFGAVNYTYVHATLVVRRSLLIAFALVL
jgi:hypothetical protein